MKTVILIGLLALTTFGMRDNPMPVPAEFEGGKRGLVDMLAYVKQATIEERVVFSRMLAPTKEDCEVIFDSQLAASMYRWERKLYRRFNPVVTPYSKRQTELACWQSSRSELLAYEGEARNFPGGYREIADHINPGIEVFRVKFLEPGRNIGAAYDLFVFVNGHWVLLWQPWRMVLS